MRLKWKVRRDEIRLYWDKMRWDENERWGLIEEWDEMRWDQNERWEEMR